MTCYVEIWKIYSLKGTNCTSKGENSVWNENTIVRINRVDIGKEESNEVEDIAKKKKLSKSTSTRTKHHLH